MGNHTVKSGSTLQSLTALSVGEAESYAGGERRSSWTIPEIFKPGSGNSTATKYSKIRTKILKVKKIEQLTKKLKPKKTENFHKVEHFSHRVLGGQGRFALEG